MKAADWQVRAASVAELKAELLGHEAKSEEVSGIPKNKQKSACLGQGGLQSSRLWHEPRLSRV